MFQKYMFILTPHHKKRRGVTHMFSLFKKKTPTLSTHHAERLKNQALGWEIHINHNLDPNLKQYHVILGQRPITFEELQDFYKLYAHNNDKKNRKTSKPLDDCDFSSTLFKDMIHGFSGTLGNISNTYEFMRYIIVSLTGIPSSLLSGIDYFTDHERYRADEGGIYWSFLDQECYFGEKILPLSYILLYSHEATKSYYSLCFENMTDDTLDDIYNNKVKGYSLLDSSRSYHSISDFKLKE